MSTHSIPTTGIQGIRFRSRIEAQWAEMFTKLGWEWEYEPIDLNGYIPDFIIKFPYKHLLVEVKGDTDIKNIEKYADKIIKSGWNGEFLLVCSVLNDDVHSHSIYLGLLGATQYTHMSSCWIDEPEPCYPTIKDRDYAYLTICDDCKKYTIYNDNYGWFCRNCGSGDSNKSLLRNRIEPYIYVGHKCGEFFKNFFKKISEPCECITHKKNQEYEKIKRFWVEAKNHTQWKGK